jgi:hypothetical protein
VGFTPSWARCAQAQVWDGNSPTVDWISPSTATRFEVAQRAGKLLVRQNARRTKEKVMYYLNGGINTCFLFGFAEEVSPTTMRLHVTGDDRTAMNVRCEGARLPAYRFEPVILAGSLTRDENEQPLFIARHTLSASKAHMPRKLSWRPDRCPDRLGWSPINPLDKFRYFPEVLERVPDEVTWPADIRAFALHEGGLFEQMLTEPLSQKRCWGVGLVAAFADYRGIETPEDDAPTVNMRLRLGPEKDATAFDGKMSMALPGARAAVETLRRRDPRRSPIAVVARVHLLHDEKVPRDADQPAHRWGFRVESLQEAGIAEIRDPRTFLARKRTSDTVTHAQA